MFITDEIEFLIFESKPSIGACLFNPKFEMWY